MGRGDEKLIEDAFERYLVAQGWTVRRQVNFLDVEATRGSDILLAEVKGHTGSNTNLDLDTMFGQLLRRMKDSSSRYAVVVAPEAVPGVARVPKWVRERLRIDLFEVDLDRGGSVRKLDDV